jgi:spore germination protein YaaH
MKKYFFLILIFSFFILPNFCFARENIFYMSQLREQEGIASLQKNADKIDILAPQFYAVSASMQLNGGLDAGLKKAIKQAQDKNSKIKVMPLVANSGFNQNIMHSLLTSEKAQSEIISALIAVAKKENYIGWQYDFENINYLDKDLYSAFVEKTAKSFHENNLIISVAAVSRYVDFERTEAFRNWSGAFDYVRLAKAVDFISLMTYDDPESVGPVASLPFIKKVLTYVKDKIPPEKLSLGIPLYYWGWSASSPKKVISSGTYTRLSAILRNLENDRGFDEKLGASWLTYSSGNQQYKLWYQDKMGISSRIGIMNQNKFRGFSAWVLGVEDPGIWNALSR